MSQDLDRFDWSANLLEFVRYNFAAVLLSLAALACVGMECKAQFVPQAVQSFASACQECPEARQSPDTKHFDSAHFEFLTNPKPYAPDGRILGFEVTARILIASPLIVEVLDTAPWGFYEPDNCGIRAIHSVDTQVTTDTEGT